MQPATECVCWEPVLRRVARGVVVVRVAQPPPPSEHAPVSPVTFPPLAQGRRDLCGGGRGEGAAWRPPARPAAPCPRTPALAPRALFEICFPNESVWRLAHWEHGRGTQWHGRFFYRRTH